MILPLPTDVADPRLRLERAHQLLREAKANHARLPASLLTDATSFIPPEVAAYFGIVTDQGQIPDAWPFIEHLHTALDDLQTVLQHPGRTVRTAKRTPTPTPTPTRRNGRAARA